MVQDFGPIATLISHKVEPQAGPFKPSQGFKTLIQDSPRILDFQDYGHTALSMFLAYGLR